MFLGGGGAIRQLVSPSSSGGLGAIFFVAAVDGGNNGGTTNSLSFSYTVGTGPSRLLVVAVGGDANSGSGGGTGFDDVTGVTYNGVSLTLAAKNTGITGFNDRYTYFYYLFNPPSGAHNVVVSCTHNHYLLAGAADYMGVSQAAPEATNVTQSTGGSGDFTLTSSITTSTYNDFVIAIVCAESGVANHPPSSTSGMTLRTYDAAYATWALMDSTVGVWPPRNYSMTVIPYTGVTSFHITTIAIAFKPDTTPTTGPLYKPTGSPTMISNSLSSGMVLYAFDKGNAFYSVVYDSSATAHTFDPPNYFTPTLDTNLTPGTSPNYYPGPLFYDPEENLNINGLTVYGNSVLWGGVFVDDTKPGAGFVIPVNSPTDLIRTAVDLANQGTGAAFTLFATFLQTVQTTTVRALIAGRGYDLDNIFSICSILINNGIVAFDWSSSATGSPQSLASNTSLALNVLTTVVVTCVNTAPGVTDIKLYQNGALVGEATGQTMYDVPSSHTSGEDQLQPGAYFHSGGGQQYNTFGGSVYQFGIANRVWSQADAQSLANFPYQLLKF